MDMDFTKKCSVDEIRRRFDKDVERFSNFETGQTSTIDAPLNMELITEAAIAATSPMNDLLDIGCGAGNNTLKLLQKQSDINCDLLDISFPMLEKAHERISCRTTGHVKIIHDDFRTANLSANSYDVIFAAAVFHHLRDDADWEKAFQKLYTLLRVGGSVWITDLVAQENTAVFQMMWAKYGQYLETLGGTEYQKKVFEYIDFEDSPRSVTYQMDLLHKVGFRQVEILHKNSCFAAFGAIK